MSNQEQQSTMFQLPAKGEEVAVELEELSQDIIAELLTAEQQEFQDGNLIVTLGTGGRIIVKGFDVEPAAGQPTEASQPNSDQLQSDALSAVTESEDGALANLSDRFVDQLAEVLESSILDAPSFTREVLQEVPTIRERFAELAEELIETEGEDSEQEEANNGDQATDNQGQEGNGTEGENTDPLAKPCIPA